MPVSRDDFVAVFPEFKDTAMYPVAAVTFWLTQAGTALSQGLFGQQIDLATMLYVSHNLTLSRLGASGGVTSLAPVTSKAVGSVSKSMDTSALTSQGAGIYNGSTYGLRLYNLIKSLGAGPLYRPSLKAAAIAGRSAYPYLR